MSFTYPTLTTEIAFVSDPLDTTPTWVDVSAYVRYQPPVTITRGRSSVLSAFSAGTCSLTLNNRARRFDPLYTSGPYYGNLLPGKQIRLTAVWASVDYPLFQGWITNWPQGFSAVGKDATVTIQAQDAIAWMSKNRLPTDLVYDYADGLGNLEMFLRRADSYYWLDETGNAHHGSLEYGVRTSSSSGMPGSSSAAVTFNAATVFHVDDPPDSAGGPWSLSFVITTTQADGQVMGDWYDNGFSTRGVEILLVGGKLQWRGRASSLDTISSVTSPRPINDGQPHHIVITGNGAGDANDLEMYIDADQQSIAVGPRETTDIIVGTAFCDMTVAFIGDIYAFPASTPALFQGSMQDVAFWSQILTADEVTELYDYTRGFYIEDMATRVDRLLDEAGWPAGWRDISTSFRAICGELVTGGRKIIEPMQQLERTENGRLFASKTNDITFRQRYFIQEETRGNTVQVIFSDDGAANAVPYKSFGFELNSIDIQNDITVTAAQVGQGRAVDLTSVNAHGPEEASIDTVLSNTNDCNAMAAGLLWQRKDPVYRSDPIVVPRVPDALWPDVLDLELGDRIQGENTPMKTGAQNVQEMTLEQVRWTISKTWEFVALGAPVPPGFFVVDVSEVDGPDVIGY